MKEFNLEEAREGKPVCTRDGRKARIICFDRKDSHYPVVALVQGEKDNEMIIQCSSNGEFHGSNKDNSLIMETVKHEGWVNLYRSDGIVYPGVGIHNSKDLAYTDRARDGYLTTIKIEWEE